MDNRLLCAVLGVVFLQACATSQKKEMSKTEKAMAFVEIAHTSLLEADPISALQNLDIAESLDPKLPEIYHNRALAYVMKKDTASAIIQARKAVELAPNYSDANTTLGKLYLDQGNYNEAKLHLNRAIRDSMFRDAYKAHTLLGILAYRLSDDASAKESFARAIELSPNQACFAHFYLGHLSVKKKDLNGAVDSYKKSTNNLCTQFVDGHMALGIAYEKIKRWDLAKKKFLEVQNRFAETPQANQAIERLKYIP